MMAVPSRLPRVLLVALAALVLVEVLVIVPHPGAVVLLASVAWMIAPGVVLMRRVHAPKDPSGIAGCLIGPAFGLGFSVFGVFLFWAAGVQNWIAILAGPVLTWLLVLAASRFGGPTLRFPVFDRRDAVAVAIALAIVPLVTMAPYAHVRERVAEGEAYRAYFTADFVWAMTVTAELAKGGVPPANPFLNNEALHYYWMAHFLSGALYRNVRGLGITVEQVVLVDGLMFGLAAVAFLYGLVRLVGANAAFSLLAVAAAFLANSYEGADMIRSIVAHHESWAELKLVNIDAITRWFYKGMPVDGLQRLLLYQPHHLTGYMLALAALWLVGVAEDVRETSVALWAGILLAMTLIFSTFTALIVGLAVALLFAVRLIQQRAIRSAVQCGILGGAPVAIGVAITNVLGYTDTRSGFLLQFGANPVAFEHVSRMLVLSFGPLLLGALAALARGRWLLREGAAPVALVLAAFAFYFFTTVPDTGGVWVGWRSGHLLLIAFAALTAAALDAIWVRRPMRPLTVVCTTVALAVALPTVAVDVYNAQDIYNREQGPAFPWTLIVTPEEREAFEWIRQSTPADAIVQVESYARGSKHWAYMQAFGQRRSIGIGGGSMIPEKPYRDAADQVLRRIFRNTSAGEAYIAAKELGISYLAFGRVERRAYTSGVSRIAASPELFPQVFRNDEMTIFRVE